MGIPSCFGVEFIGGERNEIIPSIVNLWNIYLGKMSLVEWTNQDGSTGSKVVGPYTVREPDITPPKIVGGTVANGEIKVNPGSINAGGFRYDFDERVTGSIKLVDAAGIDLNWIASVAGQTATLTRVVEQALLLGSTYFIEIDVRDTAGNPSQIRIIFITHIKEVLKADPVKL